MSIIDQALTAILKGANPDHSDEDIAAQVEGLKQSGGNAVQQALNFIPGLNAASAGTQVNDETADKVANNPMTQTIAKGLTGEPLSPTVPNPGNPVSDVAQGALVGAMTPSVPPPAPTSPSSGVSADIPATSSPNLPPSPTSKEPSASSSPVMEPSSPSLPTSSNDNAARQAALAEIEKRRKLSIIPNLIAGAGDAAATGLKAFGINAPTDAQSQAMDIEEKQRAESKGMFEDKLKNDPNSDVSKGYRDMVTQIAPTMANDPNFQNMSAKDIGDKLPLIDTMMKAKASEDARKASLEQTKAMRDVNIGLRQDQQQDKLEQQAKQMVSNLRGDKSLARTEEQRDAAAVAYNRINEIQKSGKGLNPIDYTDILGQIYKARTGNAPGEEVLKQIRQATAKGKFDAAYTFITGQQAPATTQDITNSLKQMALSMGQQADKFHEGYMNAHLIKPTGLDEERWNPIKSTGRGMTFAEATQQTGGTANNTKTIGGKTYVQDPSTNKWHEAAQ